MAASKATMASTQTISSRLKPASALSPSVLRRSEIGGRSRARLPVHRSRANEFRKEPDLRAACRHKGGPMDRWERVLPLTYGPFQAATPLTGRANAVSPSELDGNRPASR